MSRRILLLASALLLTFAGVAYAGYDGPSGTATVSGDQINVNTSGFGADTTVNFTMSRTGETARGQASASAAAQADGEVVATQTVTADSNGNAAATFDKPTVAGTYIIRASGFDENGDPITADIASVSVSGDGTTTTGGGSLPRTGDDSSLPLARIGAVLLAVGAAAVYAGSKRRSKISMGS